MQYLYKSIFTAFGCDEAAHPICREPLMFFRDLGNVRRNSLMRCKCQNLPFSTENIAGNAMPVEEIQYIDASDPVNDKLVLKFGQELKDLLQWSSTIHWRTDWGQNGSQKIFNSVNYRYWQNSQIISTFIKDTQIDLIIEISHLFYNDLFCKFCPSLIIIFSLAIIIFYDFQFAQINYKKSKILIKRYECVW